MLNPRGLNLTATPSCGVSCLAAGLYQTACSLANQTCLCNDDSYNDWVTDCVKSNCTVKDQLRTQRQTKLGCGITAGVNDYKEFMLPEIIVFAFSTLFFALRIANRATRMAPWGWDDTTITISYILCVCLLGVGVAEVKLDAGKELWDKTFSQIDDALMVFFIGELLYSVTLAMIKSSFLFLYIRIFPTESFRRIVWATQIFNFLLLIGCLSSDVVQCQPISYFWHSWDGESTGTCFNLNAFAYAHSGINIALDVWLVALPAHEVWKLNMSVRWKIQAMTMFAVGIFLTAATCVRLTTLAAFYKDPTDLRAYYPISIWTVVELNVGVVAACMPAARLVVAKTAWDIAKSTGFTRFSESAARPSYDNSNPPSYVKRRSARTIAKIRESLPPGIVVQDFRRSMNGEQEPDCEAQRSSDVSQVELVDVDSRVLDLKALA